MDRAQFEKLGTLFLAIFSSGLTLQLATDGMSPAQWAGGLAAVAGSLALAATVRLWPEPIQAQAKIRK